MEPVLLSHITLQTSVWISFAPLLLLIGIIVWTRVACLQQVSLLQLVIIGILLITLLRDGLDVMIKVISYKEEGLSEVEILKYLSSEPVKFEADNPTVPLLEILCHNNWTFSVQPRWSCSVEPEFQNVSDGLDFCIQVTKVTSSYSTLFYSRR
jgi:hypothetical protein